MDFLICKIGMTSQRVVLSIKGGYLCTVLATWLLGKSSLWHQSYSGFIPLSGSPTPLFSVSDSPPAQEGRRASRRATRMPESAWLLWVLPNPQRPLRLCCFYTNTRAFQTGWLHTEGALTRWGVSPCPMHLGPPAGWEACLPQNTAFFVKL